MPEMKDTLAKYPQFGVAVEQLRATESSFPTQGAVFGTFLQTRLAIEGGDGAVHLRQGSRRQDGA